MGTRSYEGASPKAKEKRGMVTKLGLKTELKGAYRRPRYLFFKRLKEKCAREADGFEIAMLEACRAWKSRAAEFEYMSIH